MVLLVGVVRYFRRQRRQRYESDTAFIPHIDANGDFMCFAVTKRAAARYYSQFSIPRPADREPSSGENPAGPTIHRALAEEQSVSQ
jgi:hypothetical protein